MAQNRHKSPRVAAQTEPSHAPGDMITLCLGVSAALISSMFAGYMWSGSQSEKTDDRLILQYVSLQPGDETRTDVRPIRPTVGSRQNILQSDPISTASGPVPPDNTAPDSQSAVSMRRLNRFVLHGIYADTALVSATGAPRQQLWPVKIGSVVPGAGRVIAFIENGESQSLLTTIGIISVEGAEPQPR